MIETRQPAARREDAATLARPKSRWAARYEGLGWVFVSMIGGGAALVWLAGYLTGDLAALLWLAGLLAIVLGVVLLMVWGAVWLAYQTIQANRPGKSGTSVERTPGTEPSVPTSRRPPIG